MVASGMSRIKKPYRQLTLDKIPSLQTNQTQPNPEKKIIIKKIAADEGIDELILKVIFKLQPSKKSFSKIKANLWFDNQLLPPTLIQIPQGPVATDEFEYEWVLEMSGVAAGKYAIKVEMFEPWGMNEKLSYAIGELLVNYLPKTRQSRLVRIPSIKSVAGADFSVVSSEDRTIYADFDQSRKEENRSRRDEW